MLPAHPKDRWAFAVLDCRTVAPAGLLEAFGTVGQIAKQAPAVVPSVVSDRWVLLPDQRSAPVRSPPKSVERPDGSLF